MNVQSIQAWRVSKTLLAEAQAKAKKMGRLEGSILKGQGNVAGFIGKMILYGVIKEKFPEVKYLSSNNIVLNGKKIAVRVKQRTVDPQMHFNCSVTLASLKKEKFDFFAFCQIDEKMETLWTLGFITWDRFLKEGITLHKGEKDGQFTVKEDCKNIQIKDLDREILI